MVRLLSIAAAASLLKPTIASPAALSVRQTATVDDSSSYIPPGAGDSRGPCPMLNTLANHGFIPRDGRNVKKAQLFDAIATQVGIDHSAVELAFANCIILCNFITGKDCGDTLGNLTMLALPHAFEHDASFSRQDYKMNWLADPETKFSDNERFNRTIFQTSLDVLQGTSHMDFQQMQEVRLHRDLLSKQDTVPGWFIDNTPVQVFEAAFIFAVVGDFNLDNYINEPRVRVDWWKYWFENEALPYELGWHPQIPTKDVAYVLSVSSRILAATGTTTPSPLPSNAFPVIPRPSGLPTQVNPTTTYELPTETPYVGTIANPYTSHKRQTSATARGTALPSMAVKNPYVQVLAVSDIVAQQSHARSKMRALTTTAMS